MSGAASGASAFGSRMPHWPDASSSPNAKARMVSGLPRPAIAGSASCAPPAASLRISGSGLISVFSGMKPDTMVPGMIASGNARAAIASAACARSAAGTASRRISASLRMTDFSSEMESEGDICSVMPGLVPGIHDFRTAQAKDVDGRDKPGHDETERAKKNAEPHEPSDFDPGNLQK